MRKKNLRMMVFYNSNMYKYKLLLLIKINLCVNLDKSLYFAKKIVSSQKQDNCLWN